MSDKVKEGTTIASTNVLAKSAKPITTSKRGDLTVTNRPATNPVNLGQKVASKLPKNQKSNIPVRIGGMESRTNNNRKPSSTTAGYPENSVSSTSSLSQTQAQGSRFTRMSNVDKGEKSATSAHQRSSRTSRAFAESKDSSVAVAGAARGWKSPFKSFITQSVRRRCSAEKFAYDLSVEELKFNQNFSGPMKPLSQADRELLQSGGRLMYLNNRYAYSPDLKYNFPEATSWRIGWLLNERRRQETTK